MANKRLTNKVRAEIKDFLLQGCTKEMKPQRGRVGEAAIKFGLHRTSISNIWKRAKACYNQGVPMNVNSKQVGNKKPRTKIDLAKFKRIAPKDRRTIRQLAGKYEVSHCTIWRWIKDGSLKNRTSRVHPAIKNNHKIDRVKWCLEALQIGADDVITFKDMSCTLHIDEKWFYMQKIKDKFILLPEEDAPYTSCESKHFIGKVMFLCCVGRPIFGPNGEVIFDGKIGIWPFVEKIAAKKNSKNRPEGTLETKNVRSITRKVVRKMLIRKVLPAIKAKWPSSLSTTINIQQDNAKTHVLDDGIKWRNAASTDGFNMKLVNQPAKSPDCNILDLGFFYSIQALQQKLVTKTIDELIAAVTTAYAELKAETLDKVFISLQMCMIEIMVKRGHNNYKMPHQGKDRLARLGQLKRYLEVDSMLVMDCIDHLRELGKVVNNSGLMEGLGYSNPN